MSWKGFKKALERMPHQLQSKIGRGSKTTDPEFDELKVRFEELEKDTNSLFEQTAQFRDSVRSLLIYQTSYLEQILAVYRPISTDPDGVSQPVGSYIDEGASPELLRVAEEFHTRVVGIKARIDPQLESLDVSVVGPIQEMMAMMRNVHKVMQKREHKKIDYDRFKDAVEKAEAKEATDGHRRLPEEKAYQKHAAQYQEASRQYTYYNEMLKGELRQLLDLRQAFIDPIFLKFFRIQHHLYSDLFREFSDAARNCPAFDLSTPVIAGWQQKWSRAEQNMAAIDLWGGGHMAVTPINVQETPRGVFDTVKNPFKKKEKSETPSAASLFSASPAAQPAAPSPYGSVAPYGSEQPSRQQAASPYGAGAKLSPYGSNQPSLAPPPPANVGLGVSSGAGTSAAAAAAAAPRDSPYGNYDSAFPPGQQQQQQQPPPPAYGAGPAVAPPPEKPRVLPPSNVQYVEALYDYAAQAEGDLSFKEGDRIELVKRTEAKDDWWTGRLNGVVGVFPGTYVTDPK
ncbi:BAR adaptor protein Hob1 [Coemansia sp. RSA 2599]|nr:BAR adaptor protein Hob1 [Coemansia sp. RSA 2598]KAJ1828862.1 BAR adaptor protein Hob1 [Coemansia sp. RSA 2599]